MTLVVNPQGRGVHRVGRGGARIPQKRRSVGLYWPVVRGCATIGCACCRLGIFRGGHVHQDGSRR